VSLCSSEPEFFAENHPTKSSRQRSTKNLTPLKGKRKKSQQNAKGGKTRKKAWGTVKEFADQEDGRATKSPPIRKRIVIAAKP